jgi:DNA-binding NtrC family response regulator
VIAATNRDPREAVGAGKLARGPLLSPERVPARPAPAARSPRRHRAPGRAFPGRDRGRGRHGAATSRRTALERLRRHSWPGNVRELRNVVQRSAILAGEKHRTPKSLPLRESAATPLPTRSRRLRARTATDDPHPAGHAARAGREAPHRDHARPLRGRQEARGRGLG